MSDPHFRTPPSSAESPLAVGVQAIVPGSGRKPLEDLFCTSRVGGPLLAVPMHTLQSSVQGSIYAPSAETELGMAPAALGLCRGTRGCQLRPGECPQWGVG